MAKQARQIEAKRSKAKAKHPKPEEKISQPSGRQLVRKYCASFTYITSSFSWTLFQSFFNYLRSQLLTKYQQQRLSSHYVKYIFARLLVESKSILDAGSIEQIKQRG